MLHPKLLRESGIWWIARSITNFRHCCVTTAMVSLTYLIKSYAYWNVSIQWNLYTNGVGMLHLAIERLVSNIVANRESGRKSFLELQTPTALSEHKLLKQSSLWELRQYSVIQDFQISILQEEWASAKFDLALSGWDIVLAGRLLLWTGNRDVALLWIAVS